MKTPPDAHQKLKFLFDHFGGYAVVSERLGYSYSYIHQILSGKVKPGKGIKNEINKLYASIVNNPPSRRYRYRVEFKDQETLDNVKSKLSGDEIREILIREAKKKC